MIHELKRLAQHHVRDQSPTNELQPTALVNEVYVRLAERDPQWTDRQHFMRLAGRVMRQVVIDHARKRRALKRRGPMLRVALDDLVDAYERNAIELLDLDDALRELAERHPKHVEIVELRFFAGRPLEEIAQILDCSTKTIERRWRAIKTILRDRLD
ncbi:MAG: sigma-70 family RNA polymerase sigma factor [Planctomycetes bacterium]|nr:sigma-70 family RNA polymerase sigma factor [Planctomycetota bacterium]